MAKGKLPYSKWYQYYQERNHNNPYHEMNRVSRPAMMDRLDRTGYIAENGLNHHDASLLQNNPKAFDNKVNDMIRRNEGKKLTNGQIYKDYALLKANKRADEKKKKGLKSK